MGDIINAAVSNVLEAGGGRDRVGGGGEGDGRQGFLFLVLLGHEKSRQLCVCMS